MANEDLDKYFDPEHPWVRGLFTEDIMGLGTKLDDASSQRLAKLTGWKPRDENGHRYHNALLMMDIQPGDVLYHHMYNFVKGWGEKTETLKRCGMSGDVKEKCFEYFHLFHQFRRPDYKGLNVDDMLSIAIMVCYLSPHPKYNVNIHQTELTKQGRRDFAHAVIEKGKAVLEQEQYLEAQDSSVGLTGPMETEDERASARRVAQKRMERQKKPEPTKAARGGPSVPPSRVSSLGISTPYQQRDSSPMSWTPNSSSGKRQPTRTGSGGSHLSGGKSHGFSRSSANIPPMTTGSSGLQANQPGGDNDSENDNLESSVSHLRRIEPGPAKERGRTDRPPAAMTPGSSKNHQATQPGDDSESDDSESSLTFPRRRSHLGNALAQMTPASGKSHEAPRPDDDSEHESWTSYLSRPPQAMNFAKDLARMNRRAARGTMDSPLAHKGKMRAVLAADKATPDKGGSTRSGQRAPPRLKERNALWKNAARPTPKPKAGAADIMGGMDQNAIETASDNDSEDDHQLRHFGGRKKNAWAGASTLSPTKRLKESPTEQPPSPTKKTRVSSRLTDRLVDPLDVNPSDVIVIKDDDDDDDENEDDDEEEDDNDNADADAEADADADDDDNDDDDEIQER